MAAVNWVVGDLIKLKTNDYEIRAVPYEYFSDNTWACTVLKSSHEDYPVGSTVYLLESSGYTSKIGHSCNTFKYRALIAEISYKLEYNPEADISEIFTHAEDKYRLTDGADELYKALADAQKAEIKRLNKQYGRASTTIGQQRNEIARLRAEIADYQLDRKLLMDELREKQSYQKIDWHTGGPVDPDKLYECSINATSIGVHLPPSDKFTIDDIRLDKNDPMVNLLNKAFGDEISQNAVADVAEAVKKDADWNDAETVLYLNDSLKSIRETLCLAQVALHSTPWHHIGDPKLHSDRIQRIIDEIDRHRPLGSNGKHDDLHTKTCQCEDKVWYIVNGKTVPEDVFLWFYNGVIFNLHQKRS